MGSIKVNFIVNLYRSNLVDVCEIYNVLSFVQKYFKISFKYPYIRFYLDIYNQAAFGNNII